MSRKIHEIRKDLSQAIDNYRKLGEDKKEEAQSLLTRIDEYTRELNDAIVVDAADKALAANHITDSERREVNRFSYAKYMREAIDGKLSGLENEMAAEAKREAASIGVQLKGVGIPHVVLSNKRAATGQNVTVPADGGYLVQEEGLVYVDALRAKLILNELGVTFLTGLVGNLPLVKGGQFTAQWLDENGEVEDEKTSFSKHLLSPKRVALTGAYSKQLFIQSGIDIENYIVNELTTAHAKALNEAMINGSGASGEPKGILNLDRIGSVAGGENGSVLDWKKVVGLETVVAVENADLGSLAYLTNSKVRGAMKTTEKSQGTARFLMEGGEVNGYKTVVTNLVPSDIKKGTGTNLSAMIFGNFADVVLAQWGGLDFIIDPYTLAKSGDIKIVANAFHDLGYKHEKSFAAIKDIITD